MVDEPRRRATRTRGSVTPGGRYGAAEGRKHVEPEVEPRGMKDAELDVPETVPGALPGNERQQE